MANVCRRWDLQLCLYFISDSCLMVALNEEKCYGGTLGGILAEDCGPEPLHIPSRRSRAWERRCPDGSGAGMPQDPKGWSELVAMLLSSLGA